MVVECFCNVKNRKVKLSTYFEHPIKDEDFNTKWYYVPKRNIKWLCISFTLLKIKPEHRMPLDYITHLFQYESEGSLLSVLKAENWCANLEIMVDHVDTNTRFFKVLFHLTKTGVNYVDNIVRKMFQYINMLKEDGPQKWIYEEIQKMSEINNSYGENIYGLSDYDIRRITRQLHECPMEKIVLEQRAWQPELIEKLIKEHFTPQKIRIYVAAKECKKVASKKEVWFDIKYEKTKISEETMDMWEDAGRSADLKFPPENEFIPKNFVIKPYVRKIIISRNINP
ncbi:insulin-degrading enzyme-like [Temnothorax americanus]|uniref:insulin-degrading enzyme-like n=1 Tax=Temnothorax americanus TaxID=1964332 RepID=UPI0040685AA2